MGRRDYAKEYARRLANAFRRGLTKSQARGHPKRGEGGARGPPRSIPDRQLQAALKAIAKGKPLATAAREAKIAPERLRAVASENGLISKTGQRWQIAPDLPRTVEILTAGSRTTITVTASEASMANRHNAAVSNFLRTNRRSYLLPFEGASVRDIKGAEYPLETDPNLLYRLLQPGDQAFEQIYRIG